MIHILECVRGATEGGTVFVGEGAGFRYPAFRYPATVGDAQFDGNMEGCLVSARLPAGYDFADHSIWKSIPVLGARCKSRCIRYGICRIF